jgi:hypothetical protein
MEAIRIARRGYRKSVSDHQAKPDVRVTTTPQAKYGNLRDDFEKLPVIELNPIQNADGTFKFMLGYSALGGDDPLG